jgi:hypothetical protein
LNVIELKSKGSKFGKTPLKPLPKNLHIKFKMSKPDQRFSQKKDELHNTGSNRYPPPFPKWMQEIKEAATMIFSCILSEIQGTFYMY